MKDLYEDDWYCSVNIGIDEVRAMYSHLLYAIQTWLVLLQDHQKSKNGLMAMKENTLLC